MPHDKPYLDDYSVRHQADLQARWDEEAKIFNIQNQALKAAINCPFPMRNPEMCANCGELTCVKAWKEQNKLWPENEELPVSAANTTSTRQERHSSAALDGKTDSTKSPLHGRLVSGLETRDLFNYLISEVEE